MAHRIFNIAEWQLLLRKTDRENVKDFLEDKTPFEALKNPLRYWVADPIIVRENAGGARFYIR